MHVLRVVYTAQLVMHIWFYSSLLAVLASILACVLHKASYSMTSEVVYNYNYHYNHSHTITTRLIHGVADCRCMVKLAASLWF